MNLKIRLVSFLENFRRSSEHPLERLTEIGLEEGMAFLDVGCSLGFYSFCAASIVGEKGLVYALDINSDFVDYISNKAEKKGIRHIKTIMAKAEETSLPQGSIDFVFLHLVLHDIKDKPKAIKEFSPILKKRGKLVIDEENVMPLNLIRELVEDSGFRFSKHLRKTIQVFERI